MQFESFFSLLYHRFILIPTDSFLVLAVTGNQLFRLQVVSPTSKSFRLNDRSRFAYTSEVDSPTLKGHILKSIRLH